MAAVDNYLIKIQLQLQGDKELKLLTQNMERAGVAAPKFQKAMKQTQIQARASGRGLQNVSYQLQDIIVQTSGGVDVFRSLSQQLPQMLINMGAFGAVVGVVAAGLPLLIQGFSSTEEEVLSLDDALDQLNGSVSDLGSLDNQIDLDDWNKSWNESSAAVRNANEALLAFQVTVATTRLQAAGDALARQAEQQSTATFWDFLKAKVDDVAGSTEGLAAGLQALIPWLGAVSGTIENAAGSTTAVNKALEDSAKFWGLSVSEARSLNGVLSRGNDLTDEYIDRVIAWAGRQETVNANLEATINNLRALKAARAAVAAGQQSLDTPGIVEDDGKAARAEAIRLKKLEAAVNKDLELFFKAEEAYWNRRAATAAAIYPELAKLTKQQELYNFALAEGIVNQEQFDEAMAKADKDYRIATEGLTLMEEGAALFNKSFETMLDGVLMGTQSIGEGFKDMARVIIATMAKIAATQGIGNLLAGSGNSFLAELGNALLPKAAAADGKVFSGGKVVPFAKGGVVNGPTLFPMANGAGLMGEAGPEAVMPLRRGADGKLGVAGGGTNITINNMAPGVDVRTRETEQGLTIEVVMQQLTAAISQGGNDVASAMENAYSLGRGRSVY